MKEKKNNNNQACSDKWHDLKSNVILKTSHLFPAVLKLKRFNCDVRFFEVVYEKNKTYVLKNIKNKNACRFLA